MRCAFVLLACFACAQPGPNHGIVYDKPAMRWDEGLPLGNGMLGALVWGDGNPLRISIDRADLWDLRPVPEFQQPDYNFANVRRLHEQGRHDELKRILEAPYDRPAPTKLPAGRIEITVPGTTFRSAKLDLSHAIATTAGADVMVHSRDQVGVVRLNGAPAVRLIAPPFSEKPASKFVPVDHGHGPLSALGYHASIETSGSHWRAYTQKTWAVYTEWRRKDGEWLLAWSIKPTLSSARAVVGKALASTWTALLATHRASWSEFWSKSSIDLPNETLERLWYLEQYKFFAASRRGAPPISLQAVWTADNGQIPPWKGDYHHDLNTQLSYWPAYSGNHLEEGLSFLDWLWKIRPNAQDWTARFFRMPGLNVPMTTDLNGHQIGGWRQYTHSATTAAWLAHHFWLHWRYSGDRTFLRDRAYPYIREAAVFLDAFTSQDGKQRTHPLSSSPEINDNKPEAWFSTVTNYDLALTRWLFGSAAELAAELGLAKDAQRWRGVLNELPQLATGDDGRLLIARDYPLKGSHRHFSHLMAIHPLGLIDWSDGPEAQRIIRASLADLDRIGTDWWTGYSFAWLANLAARAQDGEKAERALLDFTRFTSRNSFHVNGDQTRSGISRFTYRPFTLEGNFAAAAGIQEMLLQSHRGEVLVFPAVPASWKDVSFRNLRAEGAFLISAERLKGTTTRIDVLSERGGVIRIGGGTLRMKAGERRTLP